jgi:ABC-2 type transport system ATP-binding protein
LRVARRDVAEVLAAILAQYTVEDVSVEDPPLEEVIASMFSRVGEESRDDKEIAEVARDA